MRWKGITEQELLQKKKKTPNNPNQNPWTQTNASTQTKRRNLWTVEAEKSTKQRKEGGSNLLHILLPLQYLQHHPIDQTATFQLFERAASLIITWQFHEQIQQWGSSQHHKSQKPWIPALLYSAVQLPWTTPWAQVTSRHTWGLFLKYVLLKIVTMHFICWKARRGSKKMRELILILAGNPLLLVILFNPFSNSSLVPA